MKTLPRVALVILLSLVPVVSFAVNPIPPDQYNVFPCGGSATLCGSQGGQCFHCDGTLQSNFQVMLNRFSPRTNKIPDGSGVCTGIIPWCEFVPQISNVTWRLLPGTNGPSLLFFAQYDFANSYCQYDDCDANCFSGQWPITNWHNTHASLKLGSNSVRSTDTVFENAIWAPDAGTVTCPAELDYTIELTNSCSSASYPIHVSIPAGDPLCGRKTDRCDSCGNGGQPVGVGKPINIGSGDVSYKETWFSIDATLPLSFVMSYHSSVPMYPALVPVPLGEGWTHSFNQRLIALDPNGVILYHYAGGGGETLFRRYDDGDHTHSVYRAYWPPDSHQKVLIQSTNYVLTDLDGRSDTFDQSTGLWLSTSDRWGNTIIGTYTNGNLTGIQDSEGRQATLSYTNGRADSISFDGKTWTMTYTAITGGKYVLSAVRDPIHTGSDWHTYEYQSGTSLLAAVKDDSGAVVEGTRTTRAAEASPRSPVPASTS